MESLITNESTNKQIKDPFLLMSLLSVNGPNNMEYVNQK